MLIIGETGVQNLCKQNCSKIKSLFKKWENVTTKLFKNLLQIIKIAKKENIVNLLFFTMK